MDGANVSTCSADATQTRTKSDSGKVNGVDKVDVSTRDITSEAAVDVNTRGGSGNTKVDLNTGQQQQSEDGREGNNETEVDEADVIAGDSSNERSGDTVAATLRWTGWR
ncbi:hypothetical protein PHYPSEUDO_005908 [Phytophthora pseudosyringae]|uniref:Uncharacterized protein n=1 Tax=Phytophthora pseudosyringae TaxID=221518 RepID=A0A8T1WD65_9STRA|nr:hypothetical protein PHYPSEUDO_005908 [Phytophthora pseudosyringae]